MNVPGDALEAEHDFGLFDALQDVLTQWGPAEPDHNSVMVGREKFLFHCRLILNPASLK